MSEEQTTTAPENPVQESTVLGSSESENRDWKSSLPDELKNDATLQNFKNVEDLAKTVVHQQQALGSRVPIPKTDEEKNELYGKLGRPASPEKYDVAVPDTHKEYFNDESFAQFKNVAHKIGLNNDQAKALIDYQVEAINHGLDHQVHQLSVEKQKTEELLRKEWGFDYDTKVRTAHRALQVYGDSELDALMNTEAGNHPAVIKLFARLGEDVTEDMAKNTQNNRLSVSPLDAKADIDKIYADAKHPYHAPGHPEHLNAVEKMRQLHEKVYGN